MSVARVLLFGRCARWRRRGRGVVGRCGRIRRSWCGRRGSSRSSWPLRGVVDGLDDLPQWFEQSGCGYGFLSGASGTEQIDPDLVEPCSEVAAVVGLVGDDGPAPAFGQGECGVVARGSSRTSRSSALAPTRAQPSGRPCRVHTRCKRRPQNQRGVGGAVAVLCPAGQVGTLGGLPRAAARGWSAHWLLTDAISVYTDPLTKVQ